MKPLNLTQTFDPSITLKPIHIKTLGVTFSSLSTKATGKTLDSIGESFKVKSMVSLDSLGDDKISLSRVKTLVLERAFDA
jgi:hypothetical protein